MPDISINTFKVDRIAPILHGRPAPYGREYLAFMVIFNVEKTSLISFNLYNNKNQLLTSYKKNTYKKGEELLLEGYQLETQQENLNPTTLSVWLVDGNNQRVSDIATSVLYITSFERTDRPIAEIGTGFERGQAYQAPAEPTVVTGVKPFEKPERVSVFQPKKTLSPQIKKIIDDWSVKKIIVPAWFANNNMNWVLRR